MKFSDCRAVDICPAEPVMPEALATKILKPVRVGRVVATGNVGADESPGASVVAAGLPAESDVSLLISRRIKNPRSTAIAATTTLTVVETLTPLPAFEELRS